MNLTFKTGISNTTGELQYETYNNVNKQFKISKHPSLIIAERFSVHTLGVNPSAPSQNLWIEGSLDLFPFSSIILQMWLLKTVCL